MMVWQFPDDDNTGLTRRSVGQPHRNKVSVDSDSDSSLSSICKYLRQWQRALATITDIQIRSHSFFAMPKHGTTVVGAVVETSGDRVSLALMTDRLATSAEWAVVHLAQVYIHCNIVVLYTL
jgi:hypothetical protein